MFAGICMSFYIYVCVCVSERHNHAREIVREADLSQWDAFVIMSGDGLLFEVKRHIYTTHIYTGHGYAT